MKRHGCRVRMVLTLWTLLALAGCAELFPAYPPANPSTPVHGSAVGSAAANPVVEYGGAIAVYATKADGKPLDDMLVYAQPLDSGTATAPASAPVVLDILERHFEPAVLPVQAGGTVLVQNLDGIPHDIYSFSTAHPLSLHLAAGERHTLLTFRHPGVVTVGCKIYNEMQGYIYVTDTPYYGMTDSHGFLRLADLPPGRYRLGAWRVGATGDNLTGFPRTLTLTAGMDKVIRFRL